MSFVSRFVVLIDSRRLPKAVVAAAHAFAERVRERKNGLAA